MKKVIGVALIALALSGQRGSATQDHAPFDYGVPFVLSCEQGVVRSAAITVTVDGQHGDLTNVLWHGEDGRLTATCTITEIAP